MQKFTRLAIQFDTLFSRLHTTNFAPPRVGFLKAVSTRVVYGQLDQFGTSFNSKDTHNPSMFPGFLVLLSSRRVRVDRRSGRAALQQSGVIY
jgi:hypothetical protein